MPPRAGLSYERVIDGAVSVVENGSELTLAAVARHLGVRTPSLYNHVANLEDVRRGLTVRALTALGQRVQRAAVGRAGADALRAVAVAYRRFVIEHPGLAAATLPTTEVDDPEIQRAGVEILAVILAVLAAFGLPESDRVHAARALRSALHGFATIEAAGGFGLDVDVDASFERMISLLTTALTTEADQIGHIRRSPG
jgi:AcrR family transcriptional regulator